jgi:branched-chain amino acid transport system ATP-binding protein
MILQVEGLEVCYGKSTALHGIDLEVAEGDVAALLGRNGSGRSTTLKAIMGMVPPKRGRISFAGKDITGWEPYRTARAGIAYVPEDRRVFANLTVAENLALAAMRGKPGYWTPDRIGDVFPILTERARQPARTLSGGQQQMLALARAFVTGAPLILADELSMGLAPVVVDAIFDALDGLRREGRSLLLVEQYVERAVAVADYVYILGKGNIVFAGEPAECTSGAVFARYLQGAA